MTRVAHDFFDFAEKHAAFFAEARVDELLIVGAAEPAGEQAARKGHLHFVFTIVRLRIDERRFGFVGA